MRGGSEKVLEAGGILAGGHSINDTDVKYGLSVMGLVHPERVWSNNGGRPGDRLIFTKKLGVGIVCTANRVREASEQAMAEAIASMTALNKTASEIGRNYEIHACTDVTGFGFLGHLHEMMDGKLSCRIEAEKVPRIEEALAYADEFLLTAAGQKNRNHVGQYVKFENILFAMEELLFDPQTSGGLLFAVGVDEAESLKKELRAAGLPAEIVGEIVERTEPEILIVEGDS